jgi:hypothetical protein
MGLLGSRISRLENDTTPDIHQEVLKSRSKSATSLSLGSYLATLKWFCGVIAARSMLDLDPMSLRRSLAAKLSAVWVLVSAAATVLRGVDQPRDRVALARITALARARLDIRHAVLRL